MERPSEPDEAPGAGSVHGEFDRHAERVERRGRAVAPRGAVAVAASEPHRRERERALERDPDAPAKLPRQARDGAAEQGRRAVRRAAGGRQG
eukprot:31562-Pelagococcus_subviridis.AAC.3